MGIIKHEGKDNSGVWIVIIIDKCCFFRRYIAYGCFQKHNTFIKYAMLHMLLECNAAYEVADNRKNSTIVLDALDMQLGTTGIADAETNNGIKDGNTMCNGKVVILRKGKRNIINGIAE